MERPETPLHVTKCASLSGPSKPVRSCSPRLGRFDSGAAPSQRLQEAHRLPVHVESTLVADEPLDAPLDAWRMARPPRRTTPAKDRVTPSLALAVDEGEPDASTKSCRQGSSLRVRGRAIEGC